MPLPDRETFEAAAGLFDELDKVHQLLSDPEIASMRLVVNPEKMVIKEAQRTYTYLNLFGYVTDAVVCNRVMPETVAGGYFEAWVEAQAKYLQLIEEAFAPLAARTAPYFEQEVVGQIMLNRLAEALFENEDPAGVFFKGQSYHIDPSGTGYELVVPLPFSEKKDVSLLRKGSDLTLQVGTYRRNFILPRILAGRETRGARFENQALHVRFE